MALSAEDLTGFEMLEVKKKIGTSIDRADAMDLTYALTYVFKRREDAAFTYEDALGMTLRDVQEYLGLNEEDEIVLPFDDVDDNDPKD